MLTEKEISQMRYAEKIMRIKWRWILSFSLMFLCILFFVNFVILGVYKGKIEMSMREMLIAILQYYITSFIISYLWFLQYKKRHKKLKQKEKNNL